MNEVGPLSVLDDPTDRAAWSVAMIVDVALGIPDEDIVEAHDLQWHEYQQLKENEFFLAQVAKLRRELQKEGASFKLKAQMQADILLKKSFELIHGKDTPYNIQADLIKSTVRWAGFDGNSAAKQANGGGSRFSLNIVLGDDSRGLTIDGQAESADDGE